MNAVNGKTNIVQMTRSQWRAIPRALRFYSRRARQRYVMQHTSCGICLLAVEIAAR